MAHTARFLKNVLQGTAYMYTRMQMEKQSSKGAKET